MSETILAEKELAIVYSVFYKFLAFYLQFENSKIFTEFSYILKKTAIPHFSQRILIWSECGCSLICPSGGTTCIIG